MSQPHAPRDGCPRGRSAKASGGVCGGGGGESGCEGHLFVHAMRRRSASLGWPRRKVPADRMLISGPLLLLKNPVEGSPAEDSEAEGGTRVVPRPVRSKHERRRQESKAREAPSCVRWCVVSVCGVLWFVCRYPLSMIR